MSKQKKLIISLSALLILALGYISWDVLGRVRASIFYQGYSQAIHELVLQAKDENCEPIPIFFEEEEVHLINIECLEIVEEE